ncbi:MAG: CPBP family intramembrane glutamic endopeptidase [Candidatus Acidiferrales bacterium]|jgi:membrane protease YdiL (CAAX protease family)
MASAENAPGQPAEEPAAAVAPVWHTAVFLVVLIGFSVLQSRPRFMAKAAQAPSRIPTYVLTICYELFLLGYVWLLGLRPYKKTLRELIGGRWDRWADFWRDVGVAFLFWLAVLAVVSGISYAVRFKGMEAAKFLLPQTPAEMVVWVVLATSAGFCEELIFRGYLQRQFLALTQSAAAAVALQGIVFGLGHLYQGGRAAIVISVYGAMFGALAVMRKSLRPGMMQHATQDTVSGIAAHFLAKYRFFQMLKF